MIVQDVGRQPFRKLKAELSKNSNQSAVPSTLAISVSPLTLGRTERLLQLPSRKSQSGNFPKLALTEAKHKFTAGVGEAWEKHYESTGIQET